MKIWELEKAKRHLNKILDSCAQEPQIIYHKNEPLGVVIDFELYLRLIKNAKRKKRPTIAELLRELEQIQLEEPIEIEIPPRS